LRYVTTFTKLLSLDELRRHFQAEELAVVRKGNRLSILPVSEAASRRLLELLAEPPPPATT
jgi:predicted RNA-binding protein with PUA-like domain